MAEYQDPLFSLSIKYKRATGASTTRSVSAINARINEEDDDGYTATQLMSFAQAYTAAAGGTIEGATRGASQPIIG